MNDETATPNVLARGAIGVLKAYQAATAGRVSPCRFYPSCSNYAVEAFTEHGFGRGFTLTARRLVRCRPFGRHGVDLVPLRQDAHAGHDHSMKVVQAR
ncbi:MAG TPA: membrane protein insertion efficiency factor YidD [Acidimicrobiales bacterium]